ncbi:hypothetical protein CHLNCDRAFT_144521 [Chlorella variabilis]|uniref:THH1/TOM1/TOM3 domain-containing protein n=1 Tax=Chlorella variabilis TaxID=554065 RepID=E1ZBL8_CHLVA|nr:hypothetical protein CHLNCDRAFT_144521 [Chlorella variabilis]EFN56668.1 hypothetical protein CHLNCDRAFT_144521 [Chlorella variabilis]|eukprot:XP_005848770.1 hypothetical protein CHLNCDRAFT_144521 [Chlorella variabilis]
MALYDVSTLPIEDFLNYSPSLALAIIAMTLFFLGGVAIAYKTWRRPYRFMHTMTAVACFESAGYACLVYDVIMQVFVIMAPNIIQATLYWTVGIVLKFSPDLTAGRRMLQGWLITTLFCTSDILGITIQTIGISIWASSQSSGDPDEEQIHKGSVITLIGLCLQIIFFFFFTILTIWTHRHQKMALRGRRGTGKLFLGIYLTMVLLYIRNTFRLIEFAQDTILSWPAPEGTYVLSHQQVLFYTLDTLPILMTFAVLLWAHPGSLLPPPGSVLAPAGAHNVVYDPEDPCEGKEASMAAGASAGSLQSEAFKVTVA